MWWGDTTTCRNNGDGFNRAAQRACRRIVLWGALLGLCPAGGAQDFTPLMPYQEHEKRIRSAQEVAPLTSDLFGDSISPYSGATEFSIVDVDLPGNNDLPVQVRRRFKIESRSELENFGGFGVWDLDIPYIYGNFDAQVKWNEWNTTVLDPRRCTPAAWAPPIPYPPFDVGDFFSGIRIHLPDIGDRDLLKADRRNPHRPTDGVSYPYVAQDFTSVTCVPGTVNGYPGEGFVVVTPDGRRYTLNAGRERAGGRLSKYLVSSIGSSLKTRGRTQVFLMASRVEDRHGNWVNYHYNGDRLVTIEASDGRRIDLSYNGNTITQVTAHGRTWRYEYAPIKFGLNLQNHLLTRVTRPDGSTWQYGYEDADGCTGVGMGCPGMLGPEYHALDINTVNDRNCPEPFPGEDRFTLTATHPSGATGRFRFSYNRLHRTGTPYGSCIGRAIPFSPLFEYTLQTPDYFDLYTILEKTLAGPGVPEQTWTYGANGPLCRYGDQCPDRKITRIWQPDGSIIDRVFGIRYGINDGKLLEMRTVAADGTVLRSETTTYVSNDEAPTMPFPDIFGTSYYGPDDPMAVRLRPTKQTTIQQDGATFQHTVNAFDALARPTQVTKASSLDYGRYRRVEETRYHDNTAKWVLGQVHTLTQVEPLSAVMAQTDYDAADRPWRQYRFGWLQQTLGYYADGTVATVTDGNGSVATLSAWKRGVPQAIRHADGNVQSASVDDHGWIRSLTDENGFATRYDYDPAGRLTRIDHPENDSVAWQPSVSQFSQAGAARYGLPAGHWQQTVSTGNARQVTYFDAFWRPVVEERFDAADPSTTLSQTVNRYDPLGRKVFQSYPVRGLGSHGDVLSGTRSTYDALGRLTRQEQDSELGPLVTTTQFLNDFQERRTDPRGQVTTTTYQAYDQPTTEWPVTIAHPEGRFTDIQRDPFGLPISLRRRNADSTVAVSRHYVYDGYRRLCKSIEPENGATVMDYDAAGNLAWSAAGLSLTDQGQCNTVQALASGRVVQRHYDTRNRLTGLVYPDGNGDQQWSYWPDGEVQAITTYNDGIATTNTYSYNKRRLLSGESLAQADGASWAIGYGYSTTGALAEHVYPSGRRVEYAPNALGQPTRASGFASDVRYFPNGAMARFTYGNGVVHTLQQNVRGLPERSRDAGSEVVLDDSYDYDGNGNVAAISDGLPGSRGNRDMQYDGLDRLTATTSPMFDAARYRYDVLDNLLAVQIAGRDHRYYYDPRNRLANVMQVDTGATVIGLDYDEQGNLAKKNGQVYRFDLGNRLREAQELERYRYDGQGRRIQADHPSLGPITSMYGQDGVLRTQHNTREALSVDYILLNGSQIAQVEGLIAAAPPTVTVPGYSTDGRYSVQWTAVTGAASYELRESDNGAAWQTVFTGGGRAYAVTGKGQGHYSYQARSCNAAGCGRWSATAAIFVGRPPSQPSGISVPAIGVSGQYRITWQPPIPRETGPTRYVLQEAGTDTAWTGQYDGPALEHTFTGKPAGSYRYRVMACNPYGCSAYLEGANPLQVIYPPPAPAGLTGPEESLTGSLTLQWAASAGASSYQLEEAFNSGNWAQVHNAASTQVTLNGRQTGSYQYRALACNNVGCSAPSAIHTVAVTVPPPTAPAMSVPAHSTTGSFNVGWTALEHTTYYQLQEHYSGTVNVIHESGERGKLVSDRISGTWGYSVRGCNKAGCGPFSSPRMVQVLRVPDVPRITGSTQLQTSHAPFRIACSVSWTPIAHADRYQLQAYANGQLYAVQYDGPLTSVGSLWLNNQYTAQCAAGHVVRACNASGCSAWSNPVEQSVEIIPTDPNSGIPI